MQTFDSIGDARNAIMDFRADHWAEVPEHLRSRLRDLIGSPAPVDQVVSVGEFIWANRDQMTAPAWALAAGLIAFATTYSFHGLQDDDRGNRIVLNLRVDLGEIKSAPAAPEAKMGMRLDPPAPPTEPEPTTPPADADG